MMKSLTLLGIILLIVGLSMIYESSIQFENSADNSSALQSATILPYNSIVIPFVLNSSTVMGSIYVSNSTQTAYYVVNQSAFSKINLYLNSTLLLNQTKKYEGSGVMQISTNSLTGGFPNQNGTVSNSQEYFYNGSALLGPGTYYNILQNYGNYQILVYYSIIKKVQISVNNSIILSSGLSLFGFILLIIGFILTAYSIMIKDKDKVPVQSVDQPDVTELYSKYSTKSTKPKSPHKKHKRKK